MKYPAGSRISIRSIKLEINDKIAFNPLSIEVEYEIHCQIDTPIQRQNYETNEITIENVKKTKTLSRGTMILPMDKFDKLNIDLDLEEYENFDMAWKCMYKLKVISEKIILANQIQPEFVDSEVNQIVVDLSDIEGTKKDENKKQKNDSETKL
jgi:hypothetical protein